MNNTVTRIKQYIDYKGISIRKFEESVGFSNGAFASQYKNNKTIGVDKLENILQVYQDINIIWLLTGKGSMLTNSITVVTENLQEVSQYKKDLAAKDEIIALKDSIIRRSDKLTDALEGRIKELESKLSSYEVQGLGSALNVGQYTSFAPGLPIKK